jgi:hypothetical protein
VIEGFSIKKAAGNDQISARALEGNVNAISLPIVFLINLIIQTSSFPDCLKIARVKPLFKKGKTTDCNNYRPISILSVVSKVIEKILASQIRGFLETFKLFTDNQYGFRKGKNTTDAISRLMEDLYQNFNDSTVTQGLFLDFSKAFDTIDHQILLQKLNYYNFSHSSISTIASYLRNRKQFVRIGNTDSEMLDIKIGVPQGSVLGPLLFLIFINDLVKASPKLKYILFADDTNIFSDDPVTLKAESHKIERWCLANRLILNNQKTIQIIFRAPNKRLKLENYSLTFNNTQIKILNETKFLGIILDYNITFKEHINALCNKLKLSLLMMRAIRPYLDVKTMVQIYYSFIYPLLLYGIEFWGHACNTDLQRVFTLQKACLRVILKISLVTMSLQTSKHLKSCQLKC